MIERLSTKELLAKSLKELAQTKPIEIPMQNTARRFSVPFGTEFTIQIINDVITTPYEN